MFTNRPLTKRPSGISKSPTYRSAIHSGLSKVPITRSFSRPRIVKVGSWSIVMLVSRGEERSVLEIQPAAQLGALLFLRCRAGGCGGGVGGGLRDLLLGPSHREGYPAAFFVDVEDSHLHLIAGLGDV